MGGDKYNDSALDIKFDGIHEKLDEIIIQTRSTNGRVKKLELWRMFLIGAWAVLTFIFPISWYFVADSINNFRDDIDTRITTAINQNNDKYFEHE